MNHNKFRDVGNKKKHILFFDSLIFLSIAFIIITLVVLCNITEASEDMTRSTSLERIVTKGENFTRIDYVDENGTITYAADKHYATSIKTKADHTVLEEFFGADGEQVKQNLGYYSILRSYNEDNQEYKTSYLDLDKKPVMNRAGYAIVKRTFNEEGNIDEELYYDEEEKPVESNLMGYGCRYEYDILGRNIKTTYLDSNGHPIISGQGFAIIHKSYYEEGNSTGRVKEEYYCNTTDEPIKLGNGQYGLHRDYDSVGRTTEYTYLGIDGMPMTTIGGYTTIIRSYYNDDSVKSDMYFDKDGMPVALSEGQYGVLKKDGKSIWLDINGNEMQSIHNMLFGNKWFVIIMCVLIICVSSLSNKTINIILLILYSLFVLYMTMINRSESASGINLLPLWSYKQVFANKELANEILNNILLFVPFAAILYNLFHTRIIIVAVLFFSVMIEITQYCLNIGFCETDDIISNAIGGIIGCWTGKTVRIDLLLRKITENKTRRRKTGSLEKER